MIFYMVLAKVTDVTKDCPVLVLSTRSNIRCNDNVVKP